MTKIKLCLFLIVVVSAAGCGANESILRSGNDTPKPVNAENKKTEFATELDAMKTAGFSYVYVLRRKDGGMIDSDDRKIIKVNTEGTNRRVAADEDRAFIVGSNFQIAAKNMTALYERFAVENYSPPPTPVSNVNGNANTNK